MKRITNFFNKENFSVPIHLVDRSPWPFLTGFLVLQLPLLIYISPNKAFIFFCFFFTLLCIIKYWLLGAIFSGVFQAKLTKNNQQRIVVARHLSSIILGVLFFISFPDSYFYYVVESLFSEVAIEFVSAFLSLIDPWVLLPLLNNGVLTLGSNIFVTFAIQVNLFEPANNCFSVFFFIFFFLSPIYLTSYCKNSWAVCYRFVAVYFVSYLLFAALELSSLFFTHLLEVQNNFFFFFSFLSILSVWVICFFFFFAWSEVFVIFYYFLYQILIFKRDLSRFVDTSSVFSLQRWYKNNLGWTLMTNSGVIYELEFFFFTPFKRWTIMLIATGLFITRSDFLTKRRQHYHLGLAHFSTFVLSSVVLSGTSEARLPPTPDDPLYTDHEIWAKGVHEVTPEEEARIKAAKKLAEQQAQERMANARKEQEWNDDFTDLTLFVIFGEILIFMINAYRRSSGW
jgi:hypothetical protein